MPQKGEVRHGATESGQWDGSRWVPLDKSTVDNPASFGWLDAVPGLRDVLNLPMNAVKGAGALPDVARGLINQPGATLKGFAGGASEAATPERLGLLALLTGGATLPAALGAGAAETVAQGTRVATDAPNAPRSFPEAAGNIVGAASVPALAGTIKAVPGAVERLGGTRNVAGRVLGAGFGGYEGYQHGGIGGAVAGAAGGYSLGGKGGASRAMRGLRAVVGLGGDEAAAEAATAPAAAPKPTPAPVEVPVAKPDVNWSGVTLSPEAAARTVEATNLRDVSGYSHDVAGKLAGIPGAGKARVTNVPMGQHAITDEMIQNAGGTVTPPPMEGDAGVITPDVQDILRDQMNQTSPSMQGLQDAISSANDPNDAVRRLLDANKNSSLNRFRSEPDTNPFSARVARTR